MKARILLLAVCSAACFVAALSVKNPLVAGWSFIGAFFFLLALIAECFSSLCDEPLNLATVMWEYEDQLPPMSDEEYDEIFNASRVIDGVRMFPYVEAEMPSGRIVRVWLTEFPTK